MTSLKRTFSEERRIINANGLQKMLLKIKSRFVQENAQNEYDRYCQDLISKYGSVFNPSEILNDIEMGKGKN